MKKITALLFFIGTFCSAQFGNRQSFTQSHQNYLEKIWIQDFGELEIKDIQGTPYVSPIFEMTDISATYNPINARYNNYKDEVEFERDNKVYVLPKENQFSEIYFKGTNKKLKLLTNPDNLTENYFFEIATGDVINIYKRTTVELQLPQKSNSPYKQDKPASFLKPKTTYYIMQENKLKQIPNNIKKISSFFLNQKNEIDSFIKNNKIQMENDLDLKKLANFINKN